MANVTAAFLLSKGGSIEYEQIWLLAYETAVLPGEQNEPNGSAMTLAQPKSKRD